MVRNNQRIKKVQQYLIEKKIDAFFITDINNVAYLSGFSGSTAYLIITKDGGYFFTDGRYELQSKKEIDSGIFSITIVRSYNAVIEDNLSRYKTILIEKTASVSLYDLILKSVDKSSVVAIDIDDILLTSRMIKDEVEIELIKEQYSISANAFNNAVKEFKKGESELTWAGILSYQMMKGGAVGESFDTIVASGYRGALPHGVASSKIVGNEPVIIDFGSRNQYNSDYTRMIYSEGDNEVLEVIDTVYTALKLAIDYIKVGVNAKDIDNVARSYIDKKGFGKYFNHSLGHGVGLDVHELPTINANSKAIIEDGMIFTIEPGIYLPEKFGVRLEDTVLIRNGNVEVISDKLTKYTYQLQ